MLDLYRLSGEFPDFNDYQRQEQRRMALKLERALEAWPVCARHWEDLREQVTAARPRRLVAGLCGPPDEVTRCGPRPTPMTVVATDGSQIFPDRHVEPTCYLLNISRIAFQYGTLERPLMESVPRFRYRQSELADHFDALLESATAEVVSAVRDEYELEQLLDVARGARMPGRPLLAMADGTLIRWMLRGMRNRELEEALIERYTAILDGFMEDQIPMCSYISMPGNTEVINLLRVHLGETDEAEATTEDTLAGLTDRKLFEHLLQHGERSAIFESASHIQKAYGENRICYFYLHLPSRTGGGEIGRVELPRWVAEEEEVVDLVHAVVLSECEKGDGYPMILSEAHEQAIIRAQEKEQFYSLIERQLTSEGLPFGGSRKQASKRRPMV